MEASTGHSVPAVTYDSGDGYIKYDKYLTTKVDGVEYTFQRIFVHPHLGWELVRKVDEDDKV